MDAIDVLDARVRDYQRSHPQGPLTWDGLRAAGYLRGVPVDPTGTPYVLTPDGRVTVARSPGCGRSPGSPRGRRMIPQVIVGCIIVGARAHRRQLSQCLHLPAAPRPVGRVARIGVPDCDGRSRGSRTFRCVSYAVLRGRCRTCGPDLDPLSDRRGDHRWSMFLLHWWSSVLDSILVLAAGLRLRPNRAVRDRSRASPAAQRRLRCRAS